MAHLQVDGVSVLVNDVERWRGYVDENAKGEFAWHRRGHNGLDVSDPFAVINDGAVTVSNDTTAALSSDRDRADRSLDDSKHKPQDLFFRFAFLRGSKAGLYGGVGVWNQDGSWKSPPPPRT